MVEIDRSELGKIKTERRKVSVATFQGKPKDSLKKQPAYDKGFEGICSTKIS